MGVLLGTLFPGRSRHIATLETIRAQRKVGEMLADMEMSKGGQPGELVTLGDQFSLKDFAEELGLSLSAAPP